MTSVKIESWEWESKKIYKRATRKWPQKKADTRNIIRLVFCFLFSGIFCMSWLCHIRVNVMFTSRTWYSTCSESVVRLYQLLHQSYYIPEDPNDEFIQKTSKSLSNFVMNILCLFLLKEVGNLVCAPSKQMGWEELCTNIYIFLILYAYKLYICMYLLYFTYIDFTYIYFMII